MTPRLSLIVLFSLLMLTACSRTEQVQSFAGLTQGTTYHISVWSPEGVDKRTLKKQVDDAFAHLDQLLSNYRSDSIIEQFNRQQTTDPVVVGEEITSLVSQAKIVSEASEGCYDLTSKPLFELWGFREDNFTHPNETQLQETLSKIGFRHLELVSSTELRKLRPELQIDLSSIAQGYSVAYIARLLEQQGITRYLVEIGGELQTRGAKPNGMPWRIAIERPLPGERGLQKIITIKRTTPVAVMTSGTYRHFFDDQGNRYSHILDARTGTPVTHQTVSVTVLNEDPVVADAWSTALTCLGSRAGIKAAEKADIAALFIDQSNDDLQELSTLAWQQFEGIKVQ